MGQGTGSEGARRFGNRVQANGRSREENGITVVDVRRKEKG